MLHQTLCIISNPLVNSNWSYSPEMLNSGKNWQFFVPRDFENWCMTLKNNRAPPLYYVKLCTSLQIHWWSQTWVTAWKRSSRVKIGDFFVPHDLENWHMTINKANLRDLIAVTGLVILLKFDPNHRFFSPCDLEIWCMISKNNRAPLLYYIKLCVSFQIHRWIQTEVTLRKRSIRVEISDFLSLMTLKFDGWPWKTIGHLFYTTLSFVHHFKSIGELKLKLQSRNAQFGSKWAIFLSRGTLKFDRCPWKTIGHLFYVASSFVHHFTAIIEFKLELQSGNAQSGSNSTFFKAVRPWNLTDDLAKQ